jgi:hypothetical protein
MGVAVLRFNGAGSAMTAISAEAVHGTANTAPSPGLTAPSSATPGHPNSDLSSPGFVRLILWWAAGVAWHIIQKPQCFIDWGRCSALGAATLATTALATLTGGLVSYFFLFGGVLPLAIMAGLAWGGLILTLDRVLLCSILKQPDATPRELFRMAAPRYFLAGLIALAVGVPAELVVFHSQLDVQVAVDHQQEVGRQQARLQERFSDLATLEARRTQLNQEISAGAAEASNTFDAAECEGAGTCGSGQAGVGPLHDEKLSRFQDLQHRADQIRAQNTPLIRDLSMQIEKREHQKEQELASFESMTNGSDDLLTRLLALEHLKSDPQRGGIVKAAEWIIRLLTLALEVLPVTTKLFTRGAYDAALLAEQDGASMHFDAERLCAEARAAAKVDRERALGRSAVETANQLAQAAAQDAVNSPGGRRARKAMAKEILERSAPLARNAAKEAFEDAAFGEDIKSTVRRARREAVERIVDTERRKTETIAELDAALADARDITKH